MHGARASSLGGGAVKALRSQFARVARENDRARLKELRAAIAEARALKKQRVKSVRAAARLGVLGARRSLLELRQALRTAQRAAARVGRYVVPGAKAAGASTVAAELAKHEGRLRAAMLTLAEERKYRAAPKASGTASRAERVEESDTHVKGDIPPELVPAWEKVKRSMHATARRSRAEVFLEWAENNPTDAARYAWEADERAASELEREERELSREVAKGAKYRGTVHELAAHVSEPWHSLTEEQAIAKGYSEEERRNIRGVARARALAEWRPPVPVGEAARGKPRPPQRATRKERVAAAFSEARRRRSAVPF